MKNLTEHKYNLDSIGHTIVNIDLPKKIEGLIKEENYQQLDELIAAEVKPSGIIFEVLNQFCQKLSSIEFIISLREAKNEWEEDGIWHDDGSRFLAFSLSLTDTPPEGGILEIKKKDTPEKDSFKIKTPNYGQMIIFKTGIDGYEHKINRVTKGARLIIAGWCT